MKNDTTQMTKQGILKRMLKFSTNSLGIKKVELLDPIVNLFIESLAEEIYKLSGEINNIESRISETLADMLSPDISLSAQPAHCILHASAEEKEVSLSKEIIFAYREKKYLPEKLKQLSFHPICSTKIRKGDIRYVINNGLCYSINTDQTRTLIARSRDQKFINKKSFWVALELDEAIESLNNLSFYFDFPGASNKNEYLSLLPFTTWKLNKSQVHVVKGIHVLEEKFDNDTIRLFSEFDTFNNIDPIILDTYNDHFLTISGYLDLKEIRKVFPEELFCYFSEQNLKSFTKALIWFEVEYPSGLSTAIDTMTICINAFPIANKCLLSRTVDINDILQVVPLETGNHESLLSIHSVIDAQGRYYYELPFNSTDLQQYRTYSLRRGGYERYSVRDAREYLTNLVDLLDNHSSFTPDNISDEDTKEEILRQIHHLARHIKKAITKVKEKVETQSYILIDQIQGNDVLFVKYWVTNCEQANHIKQDRPLEYISSDAQIAPESIFTLSSTIGGKGIPQSADRKNLRLKSLTNNPIISGNEDIIKYCEMAFNNTIRSVKVRKGLVKDSVSSQSFSRTIDVYLTPKREFSRLLGDKDKQTFKRLLQKNSPATFNYRIFIV